MSSNIDQIIEEIEDYIESCKFQPLSSTKIVVNKDEIQELIQDLRQQKQMLLSHRRRSKKMSCSGNTRLCSRHMNRQTRW